MKGWKKKYVPAAVVSFGAAACQYLKKFHELDFALHLPANDTLREILSLFMTPLGVGILLLTVALLTVAVIKLRRSILAEKLAAIPKAPNIDVVAPPRSQIPQRPKVRTKILVKQEKIEIIKTQIEKEIESDEEIQEPVGRG
jgi:hypothetical protein